MINRSELKSKAKAAFKGKYWWTFAACLVVSAITAFLGGGRLVGTGLIGPSFTLQLSDLGGHNHDLGSDYYYIDAEITDALAAFLMIFAVILVFAVGIASVVGAVKSIFILDPLGVGLKSYFLKNRENKADFKDVFAGFTSGKYLSTVGTLFTTKFLVFLWSLLFIIPGIYHKYVYWLVPYICAENPGVSASDARRLSRIMTDGYKLEIFVLELSFLGWRILGGAIIFGNHFVEPYVQATYAELYAELRDRAFSSGKISREELGLSVDDIFVEDPVFPSEIN